MCVWKVACGLALDDAGFDPSTLVCTGGGGSRGPGGRTGWITRSARWWSRPGSSRGGGAGPSIRRLLADSVATQDTVTQLVSAIRRVAREVPGAAGPDR